MPGKGACETIGGRGSIVSASSPCLGTPSGVPVPAGPPISDAQSISVRGAPFRANERR